MHERTEHHRATARYPARRRRANPVAARASHAHGQNEKGRMRPFERDRPSINMVIWVNETDDRFDLGRDYFSR